MSTPDRRWNLWAVGAAVIGLGCGASEAPAPVSAPVERPAQPATGGPPPPNAGGPGANANANANVHGHGPKGPPPGASGAALQDPSGFPEFHSWPAPNGPAIQATGGWSAPTRLSAGPGGGYRPQVAVGADGAIHALFYSREDHGDLMVHRTWAVGADGFGPQVRPGFSKGRNWGPDLVVRDDGSVAVVFDLADPGPASRGYFTEWRDGRWSEPSPLTSAAADQEVGSGHVANGDGSWLAYVWIGKTVGMEHRFRAWSRWYDGTAWQEPVALSDGRADAWHTNVERRPDGSMLVGFDIGTGGAETTLYVAEGRNGRFSPLEDLTATGTPGERPHFAFVPSGDGFIDHVTYFHKVRGRPVHVYTRSGGPGRWGPPEEPSKGYGGYHFDPEIAADASGRVCLVWGWDSGREAELVYAIRSPSGSWTAPRRVASLRSGKPGLASLVAGPDGAFHVVWNQGVRGSNEVYYARLAPGAS